MNLEQIAAIRKMMRAATWDAVSDPKRKFALWNPRTGDRLHFD